MTTQTIVLERLAELLAGPGRLVATDFDYANVGRISVLDADTLDVLAIVGFDFQTGYFTLRGYDPERPERQTWVASTAGGRRSTSDVIATAVRMAVRMVGET
jgi:hypothetical protein